MPNWADCELRITGDSARLKEIEDRMGESHDLTVFKPIPKELENTLSGAATCDNTGEHITCGKATDFNEKIGIPSKYVGFTAEEQATLLLEHGALNWYDWSQKNWGAKWPPSNVQFDNFGEEIFIRFDSPWAPPIELIAAIAKQYPDLMFDLQAFEMGVGYHSHTQFEDGSCVFDEEYSYDGNRGG